MGAGGGEVGAPWMGDARGGGRGAGAGASSAGRRGGTRAHQGGGALSPRTSRKAGARDSIARMRAAGGGEARAGVVAEAKAGAGAGAPLQARRAVPGRQQTKVFCKRWSLTEMD